MPKDISTHFSTLATRAAVVATSTAAVGIVAVLGAPAAAAEPAAAPVTPVVKTASASALHAPALSAAAVARSSALSHAMSKVGAPYRYGAAGPNAFDCSGLVSWAYKKAGVSLPRTSRAMASVGTPVSRAELRPGDLVFFYKPISHVGIYLGNGKVVHASSKKSPVKVSDIGRMKFTTARRV